MSGALDDLQGSEGAAGEVPAKPDCTEVAPTDLPEDAVSLLVDLAHQHWVVTTCRIRKYLKHQLLQRNKNASDAKI